MEQDKKKEDLTLEESFEKLEELLSILENRDTTLETSFQTYQEGIPWMGGFVPDDRRL